MPFTGQNLQSKSRSLTVREGVASKLSVTPSLTRESLQQSGRFLHRNFETSCVYFRVQVRRIALIKFYEDL